MADTKTTHLELIKQDPNSQPDILEEHSNLDKLDEEIWKRGKAFNGTPVGTDGGFHIRSIPYAENLETSASQSSDEDFIIRTSGGQASIPQVGDAWLTLLKGTYEHTGYTPQNIDMQVIPMARPVPDAITAELDEETFEAYVEESGTYTLTYTDSWSANPASYGVTVTNTPIDGDSITIVWDGENDATMTVNAVPRTAPASITAVIDEDTFVSYVSQSGTTTLTYSTAWSADPANYGVTVTGTPIAGDVITIAYTKEVRGTIVQSNPQKFISTGWNLYQHTSEYSGYSGIARVIKYSTQYNFKISGDYTTIEFATTLTGTKTTITPVSGSFSIPSDGYLFITGGNDTDTAIWMTWSDWSSGYNWDSTNSEQGDWEAYTETEIDLTGFMATNFPYGLMAVGTVQDEINLNIGIATSRVERLAYNSTNLATAKNSGRTYEYDEDYIYLERATAIIYDVVDVDTSTTPATETPIEGGYTAYDHGMEFFTGTEQAVYAQTLYGANLKNKLERDVLTISQQTLTDNQQMQARSNIGAASKAEVRPITITFANAIVNANGAYTHTISDDRISEDMEPRNPQAGTPATFKGPYDIQTGNHSITFICSNAVGSSSITVDLIKTTPMDSAEDVPAGVTSSEFNTLAGRIGTLSQLATTNKTSLVAAANELNGKLTATVESGNVTKVGSYYDSLSLIKLGDIKQISMVITGLNTKVPATGNYVKVAGFPTSCKSLYGVATAMANLDGHHFLLRVTSGGDLELYNPVQDQAINGTFTFMFI